MSKIIEREGTRKLTTVWQPHEEKLYVQHDSSEAEAQIYRRNARMRELEQTGKGPVRLALSMSEQDFEELAKQYPAIIRGRGAERRRAWERIAKERPELVAMEFKPRLHPVAQAIKRG